MSFGTEYAGDGHVKGQSVPCPRCPDGFIVHGGSVCLHCGAKIESVDALELDARDWDELEALVDARKR